MTLGFLGGIWDQSTYYEREHFDPAKPWLTIVLTLMAIALIVQVTTNTFLLYQTPDSRALYKLIFLTNLVF